MNVHLQVDGLSCIVTSWVFPAGCAVEDWGVSGWKPETFMVQTRAGYSRCGRPGDEERDRLNSWCSVEACWRTLLHAEGNKPTSGTPSQRAEKMSVTQNHWYFYAFHIPILLQLASCHSINLHILFACLVLSGLTVLQRQAVYLLDEVPLYHKPYFLI